MNDDKADYVDLQIEIHRVGRREMLRYAEAAQKRGDLPSSQEWKKALSNATAVWLALSRNGRSKLQVYWASLLVGPHSMELRVCDPVQYRLLMVEIEGAIQTICKALLKSGIREALKRWTRSDESRECKLADVRFRLDDEQATMTVTPKPFDVGELKKNRAMLDAFIQRAASQFIGIVFKRLRVASQDSGFPFTPKASAKSATATPN